MADVVYLPDRNPIPPKCVRGMHKQQRFTITFDPNAPRHECWVWEVRFTETYTYMGVCDTLARARKQALKRIDKLLGDREHWEESR